MNLARSISCISLLAIAGTALATGSVRPVALTGTDGPLGPGLGPGITFANFGINSSVDAGPSITHTRFHSFVATLTGAGVDSSNNQALYRATTSGLGVIARTGSQAAGLGDGVVYVDFLAEPCLSDSGRTAFQGVAAGPGVDNFNNDCTWNESPQGGALTTFIQEATTRTPDGDGFYGHEFNLGFPSPTMWGNNGVFMSSTGTSVLRCFFRNDSGGGNFGVWHNPTGTIAKHYRNQEIQPGSNPERRFTGCTNPQINPSGAIVTGRLDSINGWGLWTNCAVDGSNFGTTGVGTLHSIYNQGQSAPAADSRSMNSSASRGTPTAASPSVPRLPASRSPAAASSPTAASGSSSPSPSPAAPPPAPASPSTPRALASATTSSSPTTTPLRSGACWPSAGA